MGKDRQDQNVSDYRRDANQDAERAQQYSHQSARDNWEFLYQFIMGTGADFQPHFDQHNDPALTEFVNSPPAQAIREQYAMMGYPASIDALGYGTVQAAQETVGRPVLNAVGQWLHTDKSLIDILFDHPHLGNISAQVGGFGNPPHDDQRQWARAKAERCDETGREVPNGNYVKFDVMNLAGFRSFGYHINDAVPKPLQPFMQFLDDKPIGEPGPSSMTWLALWGIAWSPISLIAVFLACGCDCLLPVIYVFANLALAAVDALSLFAHSHALDFLSWPANIGFALLIVGSSVFYLLKRTKKKEVTAGHS